MDHTLEIRNLTKDYGDFKLDRVSFDLPRGYIMGLIGPNGAGKTTIIKCVMNLIMKTDGTINVFGLDHREHEVAIKERIGFVYDNPCFYNHLSLRSMRGIIAPFYRTWDEAVFRSLVERFELPLTKAMRKFSRGMKMKAALAIALSHHAEFIIMDEPTSGLDPISRRELLDLLRELMQDEQRSILFSTHITSDIEGIADYVTFVLDGRIMFSDSKDTILERYALIKGGNELLTAEPNGTFIGVRRTDFGFEALTDNVQRARERFGKDIVVDRASLEDIMYYSKS